MLKFSRLADFEVDARVTGSIFGQETCTVANSRQVYIELVMEALLTIFLPEERADTYRHLGNMIDRSS